MTTQIGSVIERKLRKVTDRQLNVLYLFAHAQQPPYITTSKIDKSIDTSGSGTGLGGIISSLSRIKTEKGSLIKAVGTSLDGDTKWILNEEVITKEQLKELVNELMEYAEKNE